MFLTLNHHMGNTKVNQMAMLLYRLTNTTGASSTKKEIASKIILKPE